MAAMKYVKTIEQSCCTHTDTVVDPVGLRAIDEVAFFGNYALLNIQLLLFNSYQVAAFSRLKIYFTSGFTDSSKGNMVK
ncbi:hypothetical protein T06_12940 [Trichinella sp. T6]|nr:hypothetical protein T06_7427 [Trichinella sp. T6]KRX81381.1 hypothetical protein T06_15808 [Trichinella sp. T6]KRX81382.1 hypothetical protein T06_12940 [Trichinella sp. T6]